MSAYFTIDGTVYPAQSGTEIVFDKNFSIQNTPAKRVTRFGDGYALQLPIGPTVNTYRGSFTNRTDTEIGIIEEYFTLLKGEGFDISVLGDTIHVVALSFERRFINGGISSLTVNLKEYFN